ncbi:hypothetical protein [Actomonas aquatica]|uniref:Uncharacterized protein n=1 Tax=Actomonas aquatica TaxID=2866162 RepID=A0ABZ1C6W7_9BACT|nr:hypothetical protein [Opitutus sp. WL0086]WRQ86274.1 hypothetical protein K1X11_015775 [Opitutus sp. WL0086]
MSSLVWGAEHTGDPGDGGWQFEELRRWPAEEARQGVAVDAQSFYVISNYLIGRYDKVSGERTAQWASAEGGPFIHLNAAVVWEGELWGAHSNYPTVPMASSVEVWSLDSLEHRRSIALGVATGSLVWMDRRGDRWWACFANYDGKGGVPGRDARWSELVEFDHEWRRLRGFVFPAELVERMDGYSASGSVPAGPGAWWVAGHHVPELYRVELPEAGATLRWTATVSTTIPGQALGLDPEDPELLYGIDRKTREVIVGRLRKVR